MNENMTLSEIVKEMIRTRQASKQVTVGSATVTVVISPHRDHDELRKGPLSDGSIFQQMSGVKCRACNGTGRVG